jgi:circadian clock protein KaiB
MKPSPDEVGMEQHTYTLYVAGNGELTVRARANFDRLVRARLGDRCTLTIVDILKEPRRARENRVVATPLLVRENPLPVVKILGDLSLDEKILAHLGLGPLDGDTDSSGNRAQKDGR